MTQDQTESHPWIRQYLTSLLADSVLQPRSGLQPLFLEQQIDPKQGRGVDDPAPHRERAGAGAPARVTIHQAVGRAGQVLLLGPAGSGKTTLIRQLVRELAQEALTSPQAPLPLYVPLAFFAGSIESTLAAQAHRRGPSLSELVLLRPCVLLVDALNDLAPAEQVPGLAVLRRALNTLAPQGRWIVACRSESWSLFEAWFHTLPGTLWRVRPCSDAQVVTALESVQPQVDKLIQFPGAQELVRRPRWLDALRRTAAAKGDDNGQRGAAAELPGPRLVAWLQAVASESAATHCLSYNPSLLQPLLQKIVAYVEQHGELSRATLVSIASDCAVEAGLPPADVIAVLDAMALFETPDDEHYRVRSPLLRDLALALSHDDRNELALRDEPTALALRFGLADGDRLLRKLLNAGAWQAVQGMLDRNLDPTTAIQRIPQLDVGPLTALARTWASTGSAAVAIHLLQQAIGAGRDDPQLWGQLGDLYTKENNLPAARSAFTRALDIDPSNLGYQKALAQVCRALGDSGEATETLERVLRAHHRQMAAASFELGQMYIENGQPQLAQEHFAQAVKLVPTEATYVLHQARTLRQLGRTSEAGNLLRTLDPQGPAAPQIAAEAAALLIGAGYDAAALKQLQRVEALGHADATTHIQMAQIHERAGHIDLARRAYGAALDNEPRSNEAYRGLLQLALNTGDDQTALSAAERLAELLPNDAETWLKLGTLQREAGRLSQALTSLLTAQRLAFTTSVMLELARTLWAMGDRDAALRNYTLAARNDADPLVAAEAGWALLESGNADAALPLLERAAGQRPQDARIAYDLGRSWETKGALGNALSVYTAAINISTEQPTLNLLVAEARVARRLRDIPLARRALAAALRRDRRSPAAWAEAGLLHAETDRPRLAVRAFRRIPVNEQEPIKRALANALLEIGDGQAALEILHALPSTDPTLELDVSRAYALVGDRGTALLTARAAALRQPGNLTLQRQVGRLALAAGYTQEALAALEAARVLGDNDPFTMVDMSRALLRADRPREALEAIRQALRQSSHPQVHLQHGRVLLSLNDDPAAQAAFETALEADPQLADAWSGLATALEGRLGAARAAAYAEQAHRYAPDDERYRIQWARLLLAANEPAQALRVLEPLARTSLRADRLRYSAASASGDWAEARRIAAANYAAFPEEPSCAAEYGLALVHTGAPADAIPLLQKACQVSEPPSEWIEGLGAAFLGSGNIGAAVPVLERAVGAGPRPSAFRALAQAYQANGHVGAALHALHQALALDDNDAATHRALGATYTEQGALAEARAAWERAAVLEPGERSALLALADLHVRLGSPAAVLDDLEALAAEQPNDTQAWELLARTALLADMPDRARYAAACALQQQPRSVPLLNLMAQAEHASGNTASAIATLRPLQADGSADVSTLLLLYQLAWAAGDHQLAQQALETAGHRDRDNPLVVRTIADHFRRNGNRERGLRLLRKLLERTPQDVETLAALAEHTLDANALDEARRTIDHALQLAPDDLRLRRLRAEIAARAGDEETARRDWSSVVQRMPTDGTSALHLGIMQLERGETTEAARLLRIAVAHPANQEALIEAEGYLALALRRPHEPISEDEVPMLPSAAARPLLLEARDLLALVRDQPRWQAEYGWTLVLLGATEEAIPILAKAAEYLIDDPAAQAKIERRLGLARMQANEPEAAVVALERAAQRHPDAATWSVLGQIREAQGDVPLAVRHYARAAAQQPNHGLHHLRLGTALLHTGSTDAAREHLERATTLDPARPAAWIALSSAYAALSQLSQAWSASQRAVQIDRDNVEAWHHVALLAQRRQDLVAAFDAWERAVRGDVPKGWLMEYAELAIAHGRLERGAQMLRRASECDPKDPEVWYRLAQLHATDERMRLLETAVNLSPENTAWRTELARLQADQGNHAAAIAQLRLAVAGPRPAAAAWVALARTQRDAGDVQAAEATLEKALEQQPNAHVIHQEMARLLTEQGRWIEALAAYNGALRYADQAVDHAGRGRCLWALERWDEARGAAEQALARDAANVTALVLMARLAMRSRDWKGAVKFAKQARERDDQQVEACCIEAAAALELRWFNDARHAIEHGQALAPDLSELHRLRGWLHLNENLVGAAHADAEAAIRSDPESASAYYLLGRVLRSQRRWRDALDALRTAIRLDRNYREAIIELTTLSTEAIRHGIRL